MSLLLATAGSGTTVYEYVGTGGLAFSGSAGVAHTTTYTASGGATFGGSASTEFVSAAASTLTSTGGGWVSRAAGRLSWFADRSKPKAVARVYQYAPSGGISFGGSSPSSFTASPRLRREEEELAMLLALLG